MLPNDGITLHRTRQGLVVGTKLATILFRPELFRGTPDLTPTLNVLVRVQKKIRKMAIWVNAL
jgi:hypothetical protein